MPDKKLTDSEIVKALDVLKSWQKLAYHNDDGTDEDSHELYEALTLVLDLINRLQAENEKNENIIRLADKTIETANAEIERLSTLAELGNKRANDYRVMRDRALKAEAENDTLKNVIKNTFLEKAGCNIDPLAEIKAEAYKECIEKVKEKSKKSEIVCSGALVATSYLISAKNLNNLLKELVGEDQ